MPTLIRTDRLRSSKFLCNKFNCKPSFNASPSATFLAHGTSHVALSTFVFDSTSLHLLFACVGGFSDWIHVQSCIFLSTTTATKLLSRAAVVLCEIHVGSAPSPWHTCSSCAAALHGLSSTTKVQFHSRRASQTRAICCASQRLSSCSGPSAAQAAHR